MKHQLYLKTGHVDQDDIRTILVKYTRIFNRPIEVDYPAEFESKLKHSDDNRLYIHILASPGRTDTSRTNQIYEHKVDRVTTIQPTGVNLTIYDSANLAIAEYVDNNLFLLFNYTDISRSIRADVLDKILDSLNQNLKTYNTPSEIIKRLNQLFRISATNSTAASAKELNQLDVELLELRTEMLQKMAKHRLLSTRLSISRENADRFTESAAEEMYQSLNSICAGSGMSVAGDEVRLPLGEIKISHKGKTYLIGDDIVLAINVSSKNGCIRCINKSGSRNNHPHPFADQEGHIYLGTITDSVAKLIGELDILTAALIVVEYIQNYNESEARLNIEHWPTTT